MNMKQLIKKSISQRTLFTDAFGYLLMKLGVSDKYLTGQLTMYHSYNWLKKKYASKIPDMLPDKDIHKGEDIIWICWLQGKENAPDIIKCCLNSVKENSRDFLVKIINESNLDSYVTLPDYIIRKWKQGIIPNALFSDLIRLELLIKYGGLWLDSTVLMTGGGTGLHSKIKSFYVL